jgi:hypothetical protein
VIDSERTVKGQWKAVGEEGQLVQTGGQGTCRSQARRQPANSSAAACSDGGWLLIPSRCRRVLLVRGGPVLDDRRESTARPRRRRGGAQHHAVGLVTTLPLPCVSTACRGQDCAFHCGFSGTRSVGLSETWSPGRGRHISVRGHTPPPAKISTTLWQGPSGGLQTQRLGGR